MKKIITTILFGIACAISVYAGPTIPIRGNVVKANNPGIQYIGRVDFSNPEKASFNFPGTEIRANFEGTSLKIPLAG